MSCLIYSLLEHIHIAFHNILYKHCVHCKDKRTVLYFLIGHQIILVICLNVESWMHIYINVKAKSRIIKRTNIHLTLNPFGYMWVLYREYCCSDLSVGNGWQTRDEEKKNNIFLNVPFDVCELYKDSHLNVFKGLIDEDGWALFYFRDQE